MTKGEKYVEELRDTIDALQEQIERQQHTIDLLRRPCRCDPPGSGEEVCNQYCIMRDLLVDELSASTTWTNEQVLARFDDIVKALAGEES